MNEREEFIKKEFIRRIEALKVLHAEFAVDNVRFYGQPCSDSLCVVGDIEKLARILGAELYEEENAKGKIYKVFDYEGIEVSTL